MEHLNGNIHYQLFCDVRIDPMHPLTNYKLLDDVFSELARGLKIQQQQEIEDPTAAGDTGKSLETVHEGPGHDVYGCDLLRERDALSYGSEASVGRNREVI